MVEDNLRETLRQLTREALNRLQEGSGPRQELRSHHRLLEAGGAEVVSVFEPDWGGALFLDLNEHVLGSTEMAAFRAALFADAQAREAFSSEVAQIEDDFLLDFSIGARVLSPFVHHYLVRYGIHFSDRHFGDAYRAFRRYVRAEEVAMQFTAPVPGLAASFDAMELAEDIAITRLSAEEKQALTNEAAARGGGGQPDPSVHAVLASSHAIRARRLMPRGFPLEPWFGREPIEDALATLRIVGVEPASVRMVFAELEDPTGFHPRSLDPVLNPDDKPGIRELPGPPKSLAAEAEQRLRPTYHRYLAFKDDKSFSLALRRFSQAQERRQPEDRLLDYWIGLEALFSPGTAELRYRISLRVANFVGRSESHGNRREIFEQLKRSYDARSKVAHGGEAPDLEATADVTGRHLRSALEAWIDPEVPHEDLDIPALGGP